jgi:hypothetical protein
MRLGGVGVWDVERFRGLEVERLRGVVLAACLETAPYLEGELVGKVGRSVHASRWGGLGILLGGLEF